MSDLLDDLLADLTAEGDQLRAHVLDLAPDQWAQATPAPGWSIATQVAHLAWTDETAATAASAHTEAGKQAWDAVVLQAFEDPEGFVDTCAHEVAELAPAVLMGRWDAARAGLGDSLRALPDGVKMPWFGPPMSAASMATARMMETWAHALDVYATLGVDPAPTDRIRHVTHLAVRTRDFAFTVHDLDPPSEPFRIELAAPSGEIWTYGPEDAAQSVRGSALDLCLLSTQRIHRADTDLVAVGTDADRWLDIAQCFAGPPGAGREAGRSAS